MLCRFLRLRTSPIKPETEKGGWGERGGDDKGGGGGGGGGVGRGGGGGSSIGRGAQPRPHPRESNADSSQRHRRIDEPVH